MSRWAATSTTRWRGPVGVSITPSAWKSRTAFESGIGTWSCAWKLTAAASSLRSVTGGSSSVRSTVRWLATPIRTRLLSLLSANSSRRASLSAITSVTSPSRTVSAASGSAAARSARIEPFTRACTAAMNPGCMSSPTTSAPERRPKVKLSEGICISLVAPMRARTARRWGIGRKAVTL
jgi:hypothetical protein